VTIGGETFKVARGRFLVARDFRNPIESEGTYALARGHRSTASLFKVLRSTTRPPGEEGRRPFGRQLAPRAGTSSSGWPLETRLARCKEARPRRCLFEPRHDSPTGGRPRRRGPATRPSYGPSPTSSAMVEYGASPARGPDPAWWAGRRGRSRLPARAAARPNALPADGCAPRPLRARIVLLRQPHRAVVRRARRSGRVNVPDDILDSVIAAVERRRQHGPAGPPAASPPPPAARRHFSAVPGIGPAVRRPSRGVTKAVTRTAAGSTGSRSAAA